MLYEVRDDGLFKVIIVPVPPESERIDLKQTDFQLTSNWHHLVAIDLFLQHVLKRILTQKAGHKRRGARQCAEETLKIQPQQAKDNI